MKIYSLFISDSAIVLIQTLVPLCKLLLYIYALYQLIDMIITLLISNPGMRSSRGTPAMMQPLFYLVTRGLWKPPRYGAGAGNRFSVCRYRPLAAPHVQMSVADIVEKEGWGGFRARETAAPEAVSALFDCRRRRRYYSHGV